MISFTWMMVRLLTVYTLGLWVWVGGTEWTAMSAIVMVSYGVVGGIYLAEYGPASDVPWKIMRRLGAAGFNGWVCWLAFAGALSAYPAAFGHPGTSFTPTDGSLWRLGGMFLIWTIGVIGLVAAGFVTRRRRSIEVRP